jgi:predicted phage baseplate assembly protein
MKDLRLPMNELTFSQLVELGRSVIPTVAPGWTDHNVHDPGIMLLELTAWIAEAQMYSLSRLRRDERLAYAHLLGVEPTGPTAASGLVWPNEGVGAWPEGHAVAANAPVTSDRLDAPKFFTRHAVALTTARLVRLETVLGDRSRRDWTAANSREGATFLPFGQAPGPDDRLVLSFEMRPDDVKSFNCPLSIGLEIVNDGETPTDVTSHRVSPLIFSLEDDDGSRTLQLDADTTAGLLKSGVLLLKADRKPSSKDGTFTISMRSSRRGLLRPPRLQRIAPNVQAVTQDECIKYEFTNLKANQPGQTYSLQRSGLIFPFDAQHSFTLEVFEDGDWRAWSETDDLSRSSAGDRHFGLDRSTGVISFGNGINGHLPIAESAMRVSYTVCEGIRGNLPRNIRWRVLGVGGEFGINSEAMSNGGRPQGLRELRRLVRARSRRRPIVTAGDLEGAALSFTDLGVRRAKELSPSVDCPQVRGTRTLVVMGPHERRDDEPIAPERAALLDEVRTRLARRLPVGQRLDVVAPRYVPVRIQATLVAVRNTDPRAVKREVEKTLRERLAIVDAAEKRNWPFGRDVTAPSVRGWIRKVDGVAAVREVRLLAGESMTPSQSLRLGRRMLPQFRIESEDITVARPARGSTQ